MNEMPTILIIGRPNVGKSSLINKILKQNRTITLDTPGVTRDVSQYPYRWKKRHFLLSDTGGVWLQKQSDMFLQDQVEALVYSAMKTADKVVFVTDFKDGLDPLDLDIAKALRPIADKVILVTNKADNPEDKNNLSHFFKLGLGQSLALSTKQSIGVNTLLDRIVKGLPVQKESPFDDAYTVSFVGQPNVGKSSLVNAILNEERVLVSDEAGTTRDAIHAYIEKNDQKYCFVDTAGLKRRKNVKDGIEFYATIRSKRSIEHADLVVVLLDATLGLRNQDKKIIQSVIDEGRNLAIFVNKWDGMDQDEQGHNQQEDYKNIMINQMPQLDHYPILFGSALTKKNIHKLFDSIPPIIEQSKHRIPTPELNEFIQKVIKRNPPTGKFSKRVKVYYATQVGTQPQTFIFFVNQTDFVNIQYTKFLEKQIRHAFGGYEGNTLRISFKDHKTTS